MPSKRSPEKVPTIAEPETTTRPVRVDLAPAAHKALLLDATGRDQNIAASARRIGSEHLGFNYEGGGK
jgi:hypothetical protein